MKFRIFVIFCCTQFFVFATAFNSMAQGKGGNLSVGYELLVGVMAHYKLSDTVYTNVGYTPSASFGFNVSDSDRNADERYSQEDLDEVKIKFPSSSYVHFGYEVFGPIAIVGGATHFGPSRLEFNFENKTRRIGSNDYATGIEVELEKEARTVLSLGGAAYKEIGNWFVSITAVLNMDTEKLKEEDLTLTFTGAQPSAADRADLVEEILDEDEYGLNSVFSVRIAGGYNF